MKTSYQFVEYLKKKHLTFLAGVPCSILKPVIGRIIEDRDMKYIPAVKENVALGIASGAYLAGRSAVVLMQNSGLGNIVNALTSFNLIYKIPVLIFITWRGFEGRDAPEHIIMGEKMLPMLDMLGIPNRVMSEDFETDIDWAIRTMESELTPVALILKEGIIQ